MMMRGRMMNGGGPGVRFILRPDPKIVADLRRKAVAAAKADAASGAALVEARLGPVMGLEFEDEDADSSSRLPTMFSFDGSGEKLSGRVRGERSAPGWKTLTLTVRARVVHRLLPPKS